MITRQIADIRQEALRAFLRDLPGLYAERPGEWVAYHGDRRVGYAARKHALYDECLGRGLLRDEFVVFCIEPQETEMSLGPVSPD